MSFQVGAFQTNFQQVIPGASRLIIDVTSNFIPVKEPDQDLLLTFDWNDALDLGETIASVSHTVMTNTLVPLLTSGNDDTNVIAGTSNVDLFGGVHGRMYTLQLVATLGDGGTLTRTWPIRVYNG